MMKTLTQRFMEILKENGERQTNFTSEQTCREVSEKLILAMNAWGNQQQQRGEVNIRSSDSSEYPGVVSEEHYKQILQDQHDERRSQIEEDRHV